MGLARNGQKRQGEPLTSAGHGMRDAYTGMNRLYLSMHTPAEVAGEDINDPVMSDWLAQNLPSGARILDAGCGLGFDALALHRGLPARPSGKSWTVYASDFSADMLADAARAGAAHGVPASRYRQVSFAGLAELPDWRQSMDAVTVNYAIYTQPEPSTDYDSYLQESIQGLAAVMRPGGAMLLNLRDWPALRADQLDGADHVVENTHDGVRFHCRYSWSFGPRRVHMGTLLMREADGPARRSEVWFAERSPADIARTLRAARLVPHCIKRHGVGASSFFTLVALKDPT